MESFPKQIEAGIATADKLEKLQAQCVSVSRASVAGCARCRTKLQTACRVRGMFLSGVNIGVPVCEELAAPVQSLRAVYVFE